MNELIRCFLDDKSAATAIEYALIASGISIAIVLAVTSIGSTLNNTFVNVASGL